MDERDKFIHDLRKQGFTYRAIGEILGLSPERIHQIAMDSQPPSTARALRQAEVIRQLLAIDADALYRQGVGATSIALRIGGPIKFVTRWLKARATPTE